jgi:hypothetical protein
MRNALLILLIASCFTSCELLSYNNTYHKVKVTVKKTKIRSTPDKKEGEVLLVAKKDTLIKVVDYDSLLDFYTLEYQNQKGFVYGKDVKKVTIRDQVNELIFVFVLTFFICLIFIGGAAIKSDARFSSGLSGLGNCGCILVISILIPIGVTIYYFMTRM